MIINQKEIPVRGSEGRMMGTDVFYPKDSVALPIVIYVHGFNGLKDWAHFDLIATQFAEVGFFFIKMNLSHNGASLQTPLDFTDLDAFGNNNYTKELFDVEQILNWICAPENPYASLVDTNRICLVGHSRGGGIAILKTGEDHRVKALITWASIAECKTPWGTMSSEKLEAWKKAGVMYYSNKRTRQEMPLYYQLFENYESNRERLDIRKAIQKIETPILICHGTQDVAVPYNKALLLKQWQPKAELFTIESDHVFGRSHPWTSENLPDAMQQVVDESLHFLKKTFDLNQT
jgi:dienelactone hydrolase